ncbi:hypothetical protein BKA70DRAFT_1222665 [Coprinopsis sp. MPI-PUGE-AT-0042]|nr:hypothetical protein BKA70DRAFT_1222665 [Coprinopsis sp. MPI-PUGE-AT-0042]
MSLFIASIALTSMTRMVQNTWATDSIAKSGQLAPTVTSALAKSTRAEEKIRRGDPGLHKVSPEALPFLLPSAITKGFPRLFLLHHLACRPSKCSSKPPFLPPWSGTTPLDLQSAMDLDNQVVSPHPYGITGPWQAWLVEICWCSGISTVIGKSDCCITMTTALSTKPDAIVALRTVCDHAATRGVQGYLKRTCCKEST